MTQPATVAVGNGFRLLRLQSVGSTNAECLARAEAGEASRLWITATEQRAGRGRRGRPWVSEPGNLYASLLLIDIAPPSTLGQMPFVVAVAVQEATARATGQGGRVRIKWPNDILVDGLKTAGILLEAHTLANGRVACIIGIGINCRHAPTGTESPATSLSERGLPVEPEILLARLIESMMLALNAWDASRGFGRIRERWLEAAMGLGQSIRVRLTNRELEGRFSALDGEGHLVLDMVDGRREIVAAGDVFLLAEPQH